MPTEVKVGRHRVEATLLDGVTATGDGEWHEVAMWDTVSVQVKGITNATVQIRGSNAPTMPSNTSDEALLGELTADGLSASIPAKLKYIKAKVSAYVSGTIYVYAFGRIGD